MSKARNEGEHGRWIEAEEIQNQPECIYTGGGIMPPPVIVYERRDIYNPVNGPGRAYPETGYRLMQVPLNGLYCDRSGFMSVKTNPGVHYEVGPGVYGPKAVSEPFVDRKEPKYLSQCETNVQRKNNFPSNHNAYKDVTEHTDPGKSEQMNYNKNPQPRYPMSEYYGGIPNYPYIERMAAPNFHPSYYFVPTPFQPTYQAYGENSVQPLPCEKRRVPQTEESYSYNHQQGPFEYVYMQNVMPTDYKQQHVQNRQFQPAIDEVPPIEPAMFYRMPGEEAELPGVHVGNPNRESNLESSNQPTKNQDRNVSKVEYVYLKNDPENKSNAGVARDAIVEMYALRDSENGYLEPSSRVEYIYLPVKDGDPPNPYYEQKSPVKKEPIQSWPLLQPDYSELKYEHLVRSKQDDAREIRAKKLEDLKKSGETDREKVNRKPSNKAGFERARSPSIFRSLDKNSNDDKQEQWKVTKTLMSRERAIRDSSIRLGPEASRTSKLSASPLEIRTFFRKAKKSSIDQSAQTSASFLLKACKKKKGISTVIPSDRGFLKNSPKNANSRTPERIPSPNVQPPQTTYSLDHGTWPKPAEELKKTYNLYPGAKANTESLEKPSDPKPQEQSKYNKEITSIHKLLQEMRDKQDKVCAELEVHPVPIMSQLSDYVTVVPDNTRILDPRDALPQPLVFCAATTASVGFDEVANPFGLKNEDRPRACESIRPLELINQSDVLTVQNSRKLSRSQADGARRRSTSRVSNLKQKTGSKSSNYRNGTTRPGRQHNWQCYMMNGQDLDTDELNNSDFRKVRKIVINYAAKPTDEIGELKKKAKKAIDVPAVVEAELKELKSQLTDLSQWVKLNSNEQSKLAKQVAVGPKLSKSNWLKRTPIIPDPEDDWFIM